jgi:hypothetical protein
VDGDAGDAERPSDAGRADGDDHDAATPHEDGGAHDARSEGFDPSGDE